MSKKIATLLVALAISAPAVAQAQNQNAQRPAATQNAQRPAGQVQQQITTIPQVCRIRERDIIALNGVIAERRNAMQQQTDQANRQAIVQQLQGYVNALTEVENSWARMGCGPMLYPPAK
jgi:TolA-binding protein